MKILSRSLGSLLLLLATNATNESAHDCGNSSSSTAGGYSDSMYGGYVSVYPASSVEFWYCVLGAVACLIASGLASGVNIGLMSLSPLSLKLLVDAEPAEKRRDPSLRLQARRAAKVLPLVSRKHMVLVTLLLTTAIADEVLPLCIDAIAPTWVAVVVSVTTMLLFTEVIPTAVFTDHRNSLKLAAGLVPFVWALIGLLGILTWPMAKALNIFVEKTHRQVGDPDSLAGSCRGDEVSENDHDHSNAEARQLLRVSRFRALLRLLGKHTEHLTHATSQPLPVSDERIVIDRREELLDRTQIRLLESVTGLSSIRMRDVAEPLQRRTLHWEKLEEEGSPQEQNWRTSLCVMAATEGWTWFIAEGVHGENVWSMFRTAEVLRAGEGERLLIDVLLTCDSCVLEAVDHNVRLLDTAYVAQRDSPLRAVLVKAGEGDIIGVCHVEEALRQCAFPWGEQHPSRATHQQRRRLPVPSQKRRISVTSQLHGGEDESDEEEHDVEALLNGPRVANAVPWSVKYASGMW